jgi:hypothetical protein
MLHHQMKHHTNSGNDAGIKAARQGACNTEASLTTNVLERRQWLVTILAALHLRLKSWGRLKGKPWPRAYERVAVLSYFATNRTRLPIWPPRPLS